MIPIEQSMPAHLTMAHGASIAFVQITQPLWNDLSACPLQQT